jgi:hypothetical protein
MHSEAQPITERRPLTQAERELAQWMLEHGGPSSAAFLPQVERAAVVSRCPCGCASIDFEVAGMLSRAAACVSSATISSVARRTWRGRSSSSEQAYLLVSRCMALLGRRPERYRRPARSAPSITGQRAAECGSRSPARPDPQMQPTNAKRSSSRVGAAPMARCGM